ncbi:signal peptidase I, partial [Staphylococcus epidermidis]
MKKEFKEWLIAIIVAILLLFLVNNFLFKPYTVSGLSMYPTFNNKDKVVVSKISKSLNHLKSGDVIV